jgi:hypothetical protein
MSKGCEELGEMKRLGGTKDLPESVVEKIIAMMPFPSIFKACCLSKEWQPKFEPLSSLHDAETKRMAASFQLEVAKWSAMWDTFSLVLETYPLCEMKLRFFTANFQTQHEFLTRDFLRKNLVWESGSTGLSLQILAIEGPLACGRLNPGGHLYVGNLLTQKWKVLPLRPRQHFDFVKLAVHTSSPTYKVITFCASFQGCLMDWGCDYVAHIYDSISGTWSTRHFALGWMALPWDGLDGSASLEGTFYMLTPGNCLLVYNYEEETLKKVPLSSAFDINGGHLLVCNKTLFLICYGRMFTVFKIDSKTFTVSQVAKSRIRVPRSIGCNESVDVSQLWPKLTKKRKESVDGSMADCSRFSLQYKSWAVYNKSSDFWIGCYRFRHRDTSSGHWRNVSFQPGLNTFMEV